MDKIWLLLGPELGHKNQKVNAIISQAKLMVSEGEALETIKFFASDDEVSVIAQEIRMQSLFANTRVIHVEQVAHWSASGVQTIVAAIKAKDENTVVIFSAIETKVSAGLEKAIPRSNIIKFWNLSEKDYYAYIRQKASDLQMNLSEEAVEVLLYLAGESILELDAVLQQIAVFHKVATKTEEEGISRMTLESDVLRKTTSPLHVISKEDIETWLSYNKQETVFKIVENIAMNKYEAAFLVLESLLRANNAVSQLIAGMVYQIKNALRLAQAMKAGVYIKEVFSSLKIFSSSFQKIYLDLVSERSVHTFQTMLELCVSTEEDLRSGGDTRYQELVMYMLLYHICMLHHNPKYYPFTKKAHSEYNISNIYLYDW